MIKTIEFSNILGLKKAINLYDFQLIAKFLTKTRKDQALNGSEKSQGLIMIKSIEFLNIFVIKKATNLNNFQCIAKFSGKIRKIKS